MEEKEDQALSQAGKESSRALSIDLLVAEDTSENLEFAKQYFEGLKGKNLVCISFEKKSGIGHHIMESEREFTSEDYAKVACFNGSLGLPDPKHDPEVSSALIEATKRVMKNPDDQQAFSYNDYGERKNLNIKVMHFKLTDVKYTDKAAEALELVSSVDAVITDLFFKEKEEELQERYSRDYLEALHTSQADGLLRYDSYDGKVSQICNNVNTSIRILEGEFDGILSLGEPIDIDDEPPTLKAEFAYGALVMAQAATQKKPNVLFTDIYRHSGSMADSFSKKIDGIVCLAPLVDQGLISKEAAVLNQENDLHYHPLGSRFGKGPQGWPMALGRVVEQYSIQNNVN